MLPRLKYIYVTDYLIDEMRREELKAVIAHEIGHGKRRHLLIKFGVPFLLTVPFVGVLLTLGALDVIGSTAFEALMLAFPLVLVLALILVWGKLSMRFEKSADDYAVQAVGVEQTLSMLEKLAELDMSKRKTGALFNLLAQHPGLEERVERLRTNR